MAPFESESALKSFARVHTFTGNEGYSSGYEFLEDATDSITSLLRRNRGTKVKLIFNCIMQKDVLDFGIVKKPFSFHSSIEVNLEDTDENDLYIRMIDTIEEKIQKLESAEGTGWHFHSITNLQLHIFHSFIYFIYSSYIKLPKFLELKHAIVNMKNKDEKCF